MTQPRSTLVSLDATPWYHVVSRRGTLGHIWAPPLLQGPNGISCAIATRAEERFANIYPGSGWNDRYAFRRRFGDTHIGECWGGCWDTHLA